MALKTHALTIGYNGHHLHRQLYLSLASGELACLLGPNGAGKSTLLKTLSGLLAAQEGRVLLENHDIKTLSHKELARKLSIVVTDKVFLPHTTVLELVSMGRYPYTSVTGRMKPYDYQIAKNAVNRVGAGHLENRYFNQLSDGEKQKVLIAKAIAQNTPVILLDEPTAFLDFPSKIETMQLLQRLAQEDKKAILISTHDVELALKIADKIWLMEKNRPFVSGLPEDLIINGNINSFFDRDGISFEKNDRTFHIKHNPDIFVAVEGEKKQVFRIQQSLKRLGFDVSNHNFKNTAGFRVVAESEERIILRQPRKKEMTFSSLETFINYIKILK
jgi:iron complex transport system ATP-binding protein